MRTCGRCGLRERHAQEGALDLEQLYRQRFGEEDLSGKQAIWKVLCEDFFSRYISPHDVVVDVGAGYCEFINHVVAAHRIAVELNPRVREFAAAGVEVRNESAVGLESFADASADVLFMSNFLEHLPGKQLVLDTLAAARRVLRPGGKLMLLQPNVRLVPGAYWDFFDHHTPLTDRSLVEALGIAGLVPEIVIPRFLPYSTRSLLPQSPSLVKLYLRCRPAWWLLGKQSFILARRQP